MSIALTAKPSLNPNFVEAERALRDLYGALKYTKPGQSLVSHRLRLEQIYHDGDVVTRYKVLTELIAMGYWASCGLLIEALEHDRSALVRHEAAFGLGTLGGASCAEVLAHALTSDPDATVRHEAAIAIAQVSGPAALKTLKAAADDQDPDVAASARFAIQEILLSKRRRRR